MADWCTKAAKRHDANAVQAMRGCMQQQAHTIRSAAVIWGDEAVALHVTWQAQSKLLRRTAAKLQAAISHTQQPVGELTLVTLNHFTVPVMVAM